MSIPYWGSRVELMEVIAMFPLEQAVEVYDKLKAGQIIGRVVLIPEGT